MITDELYLATMQDVIDQGLTIYDFPNCPFHRTKLGHYYCEHRCQLKTTCKQHCSMEIHAREGLIEGLEVCQCNKEKDSQDEEVETK
jgi:hypothetical protein